MFGKKKHIKISKLLGGWKLTATTKDGNEKNTKYLEALEVKKIKISDFNHINYWNPLYTKRQTACQIRTRYVAKLWKKSVKWNNGNIRAVTQM